MLTTDRSRENYGWIGAAAADLTDPDYPALWLALKGSGSSAPAPLLAESGTALTLEDGAAAITSDDTLTALLDAELMENRPVTVSGATIDPTTFYAYGSSLKCSGVQYADLSLPVLGTEDFGVRARVYPLAHAGVRTVFGFANGALLVQTGAGGAWQAVTLEGAAVTTEAAAAVTTEDGAAVLSESSSATVVASGGAVTVGAWAEVALEREGTTLALKVNEAVVLAWTTSLDLAATALRLGAGEGSADAHYQDIRVYQKGVTSVRKLNKRPMASRLRRYLCGVGAV